MLILDDKRKDLRIESVKAQFEFEGQVFNIQNISRDALLFSNIYGFTPSLLERLTAGPFEFSLVDSLNGSKLKLWGRVVRCLEVGEVICGIAVSFGFDQ